MGNDFTRKFVKKPTRGMAPPTRPKKNYPIPGVLSTRLSQMEKSMRAATRKGAPLVALSDNAESANSYADRVRQRGGSSGLPPVTRDYAARVQNASTSKSSVPAIVHVETVGGGGFTPPNVESFRESFPTRAKGDTRVVDYDLQRVRERIAEALGDSGTLGRMDVTAEAAPGPGGERAVTIRAMVFPAKSGPERTAVSAKRSRAKEITVVETVEWIDADNTVVQRERRQHTFTVFTDGPARRFRPENIDLPAVTTCPAGQFVVDDPAPATRLLPESGNVTRRARVSARYESSPTTVDVDVSEQVVTPTGRVFVPRDPLVSRLRVQATLTLDRMTGREIADVDATIAERVRREVAKGWPDGIEVSVAVDRHDSGASAVATVRVVGSDDRDEEPPSGDDSAPDMLFGRYPYPFVSPHVDGDYEGVNLAGFASLSREATRKVAEVLGVDARLVPDDPAAVRAAFSACVETQRRGRPSQSPSRAQMVSAAGWPTVAREFLLPARAREVGSGLSVEEVALRGLRDRAEEVRSRFSSVSAFVVVNTIFQDGDVWRAEYSVHTFWFDR